MNFHQILAQFEKNTAGLLHVFVIKSSLSEKMSEYLTTIWNVEEATAARTEISSILLNCPEVQDKDPRISRIPRILKIPRIPAKHFLQEVLQSASESARQDIAGQAFGERRSLGSTWVLADYQVNGNCVPIRNFTNAPLPALAD